MNPYYEKYMREASQSAGAYSVYPFCPMCPWEDEKAKDQKRVQELYPALARQIQPLVEEACDRMEYDGSFMFDEYPDQLQIRRVCSWIYDKVDKSNLQEDMMMQSMESGQEWLRDLVAVMLLNEMYQRRCRRRDRRCNWLY
ncbi:MAG: hypothetical protein HFI30_12035 [Lachnospiraceae bacterium]|jgi:hypothetical protein|nr:hypothetical protein [Lachnospiraceae bacterium]